MITTVKLICAQSLIKLTESMHKEIFSRTQEIAVENLTAGYGDEVIIENISFKIKGPALVQILGPNGAGKTTLLKAILGLIQPMQGRVVINGVDVTGRPEKAGLFVGYVPQLAIAEFSKYPITAWELVESSLLMHKKKWPRLFTRIEDRRRVEEALTTVGLPREFWKENIWHLSGGQRQRVLIARALVHDPPILVMDEPFSAVDPAGRIDLVQVIAELSKRKLVISTCHDPELLLSYTNTIILLNRKVFKIGKPEELLRIEEMKEIYGEAAILMHNHIHICDFHA